MSLQFCLQCELRAVESAVEVIISELLYDFVAISEFEIIFEELLPPVFQKKLSEFSSVNEEIYDPCGLKTPLFA
ncbi:hypothetical protein AVEN_180197-1 [Araneus ventricosus]|uniref:Uncharacterized protein n=1 Tax=Araneus ventricosus TaxID=182803 RepID=A0A4Y2X2S0_ARAVE|nr:hypothetical protein AVEN_35367-1 [Araneus ventricosus]GBO43859.1 hypothetical protein AVEN_180197-1 [Araneus ventricosus]